MSSSYRNPYVDENNKFKPGVCPNVDTLEAIYEKDMITKENCLNHCAIATEECNDEFGTGVPTRKCGLICEKDPSSSPRPSIGIVPHNKTCRAGQYCKECCVGKCLIDDKTLNMTCFLNCIDEVCTERISPSQPIQTTSQLPSSSPSPVTPSKPDILIPVTLTTEDPKKSDNNDTEGIWVYILVIVGLVFIGLSIYVIRNSKLKKFAPLGSNRSLSSLSSKFRSKNKFF